MNVVGVAFIGRGGESRCWEASYHRRGGILMFNGFAQGRRGGSGSSARAERAVRGTRHSGATMRNLPEEGDDPKCAAD
jgi:hypothetical protein